MPPAIDVETVIAEYQGSLRAFLQSRLRDSTDVDDVLQEVLTRTFRNLHRLKAQEKLKPWLLQIANNALMEHHRRAKRDASINADDLWYGNDRETEHAFAGCVEPFLTALSPDAGDLLRAIELDGVSQKDYAAEHGISYSTLKSRVQSSRRQLRTLFDQCCNIVFAADGSIIDYQRKSGGCDSC